MRRFFLILISVLLWVTIAQAQQNPRYELILIHTDRDLTQHEFAMQYNICWEQVHQHKWHSGDQFIIAAEQDLYFPPDILPCYNTLGQRLRFYEDGRALLEPYYSDVQVYVTQAGDTFESVTRATNVCIENITYQNEHYLPDPMPQYYPRLLSDYHFATGQELFIPMTLPCYDGQGHKIVYRDGTEPITLATGEYLAFYGGSANILNYVSVAYDVCIEDLLHANYLESWKDLHHIPGIYYHTILLPSYVSSCYERYDPEEFSLQELAEYLNVCPSQILDRHTYLKGISERSYFVRHNARPCPNVSPITHEEPSPTLPAQRLNILVQPGDSLEAFSRRYNVCAVDLLAANTSYRQVIANRNYIIPETPPCYDAEGYKLSYADDGSSSVDVNMPLIIMNHNRSLQSIAWDYDLCLADLLTANPHLDFEEELYWNWNGGSHSPTILTIMVRYGSEVFIPQDITPCYYDEFEAPDETAVRQLAEEQNVCIEQLNAWTRGYREQKRYIIPRNHLPCYDENGYRLSYYSPTRQPLIEPVRLDLEVFVVPYHMSTYELSRRFNVCVADLLRLNPILAGRISYPQLEVFIPQTPPCYDDVTGQQLIYEDDNGNPLTEPIRSDYLIHQVTQGSTWGQIASMYNVCTNRLRDFNRDFIPNVWTVTNWGIPERIARAEGIFDVGIYVRIPTDRPPCYEYSEARWIRYVCYDAPIDMSQLNPDAVINPDGTHCYDIEDPETVIWHEGDHYLYQFRTDLMKNDFMAWCFGVGADDIIATSDNPIVFIIPYEELLIRNPTRDCYIRNTDETATMHWVQQDETLRDIALQYGKLPSWIADANDLANPDLIWIGQGLVIPDGINLWHLLYIIPIGLTTLLSGGFIRYRFQRRQGFTTSKKKKKPTVMPE